MSLPTRISIAEALDALPPEWPKPQRTRLEARLEAALAQSRRKVVVLDDDPTGTQTVHGVEVLVRWDVSDLRRALAGTARTFYILTNSRSLPASQAKALTSDILKALCTAAEQTGSDVAVVSRSDSTLRGHYPQETDQAMADLQSRLGHTYRAQVLLPAFIEGGRWTFDDVHWVKQGDELVPVGATAFAQDPHFGFRASNLRHWVHERTGGRIPEERICSLSLDVIRSGGVDGVLEVLAHLPPGAIVIGNAVSYTDLRILTTALLEREATGERFFYRTAASFVPIYSGIPLRPPISTQQFGSGDGHLGEGGAGGAGDAGAEIDTAGGPRGAGSEHPARQVGGLVVVGSHVPLSTRQLERLLAGDPGAGCELVVERLLNEHQRGNEVRRAQEQVHERLRAGLNAVLYTSRTVVESAGSRTYLEIGEIVAAALAQVVEGLTVSPRFVVAKGGITSSTLVTEVWRPQRIEVIGQIIPGVPVWRLEWDRSTAPIHYVVFPGNVGDDESLAQVVALLNRR